MAYPVSSALSEEIDTLSIPLEDRDETFKVTLEVKNPSSTPSEAVIMIVNTETKEKHLYFVSGTKTISLTKGKYSAAVNVGSRRESDSFNFILPDKTGKFEITVRPFVDIEPTGWIMSDTFFNPKSGITGAKMTEYSQALQLRAVFTTLDSLKTSPEQQNRFYDKTSTLFAKNSTYLHKDYGQVITFGSADISDIQAVPEIIATPLFPLLARLRDSNTPSAISPIMFYFNNTKLTYSYAEEFIFDTISGPLYDLYLMNDFSYSLKIWHTLLNLGYRIPAVYIGGNNFYQLDSIPQTTVYAKIPRKEYSQKFLQKALSEGKTILSNGPFIRFFAESTGSVDSKHKTGQDNIDWINGHSLKIGGVGFISKEMRNVYAEAYSSSNSQDYIKSMDLIYNGKIIKKKTAEKNSKNSSVMWQVVLDKPGWIQIRYTSVNDKFHAVTNPIYLTDSSTLTPDPVMAKTTISVTDSKTGKNIPARVFVENFGVTIEQADILNHAIVLRTPATASIRVEAEGYQSQTRNIYTDGGGAEYIRGINRKKLLSKAFANPLSYEYLKKALLNSKLTFKLHTR